MIPLGKKASFPPDQVFWFHQGHSSIPSLTSAKPTPTKTSRAHDKTPIGIPATSPIMMTSRQVDKSNLKFAPGVQ